MNCDVVLDLMPLVKDGLAGESSKKIVEDHILLCESCNAAFSAKGYDEGIQIDDSRSIKAIKHRLNVILAGILIVTIILCFALSSGMHIYMPIIGVVSCIIFKKKWYLVPIIVFTISTVPMMIISIFNQGIGWSYKWGIPYAIDSLLGCIIVLLLKYAFRRNEGVK